MVSPSYVIRLDTTTVDPAGANRLGAVTNGIPLARQDHGRRATSGRSRSFPGDLPRTLLVIADNRSIERARARPMR